MQTECAICWGAEFPLAGEAEVVWVLWQVPSHLVSEVVHPLLVYRINGNCYVTGYST